LKKSSVAGTLWYIQMDYYPYSGKNLQGKDPEIVRMCIYQIFQALEYCHSKGIAHLDVKPSNILYKMRSISESKGENTEELSKDTIDCVLIDFGVAAEFNIDTGEVYGIGPIGTSGFMPPEMKQDNARLYNSVDIWNVGMTFYHLLTGGFLWQWRIFDMWDSLKEGLLRKVPNEKDRELLDMLLKSDPKERPSASQVLKMFGNWLQSSNQ
jgi:wee1-like protein kinase